MRTRAALVGLIAAVALSPAARAHDAHAHEQPAAAAPGAAKVVLGDEALTDPAGRRLRLASDVIGGRIAVVNFVYTTCTTVCPVSSATLAQVQERLGAALGRDVVLVSITVDPVRDTPVRLSETAARFGARAGWTWLTGAKGEVDSVLKGFGAYTPNFEDHPAMVLVGDARGGTWTRFFGFPSVERLLQRVESLQAARERGRVAHHHGKE
jgi:protein SCO1/2